jgi:hypothetical protein
MPMASIPSSLLIRMRPGEIGEKGDMDNLGQTKKHHKYKSLQRHGRHFAIRAA